MKPSIMFICLICVNNSLAQNLVPNPDFERYNLCPTSVNLIRYAIPWFQPNNYLGAEGSTDYFNECALFDVGIPENLCGYQYARTGKAYVGFSGYANYSSNPGGSRGREYLEVKLMNALIGLKKYIVSFYIVLGERNSRFAIETIGAYFSKDSILTQSYNALSQYTPQIMNRNGIIKDSINWILVTDTFTAKGGEGFMTIGNFNTDSTSNVDTLYKPVRTSSFAYYYIDDVSVIPDTTTGVRENEEVKAEVKLYPNPANHEVTFMATLPEKQQGQLEIYSIIGSKISGYDLKEGINQVPVNTSGYAEGIYSYRIIIQGLVIKSGKLSIIR